MLQTLTQDQEDLRARIKYSIDRLRQQLDVHKLIYTVYEDIPESVVQSVCIDLGKGMTRNKAAEKYGISIHLVRRIHERDAEYLPNGFIGPKGWGWKRGKSPEH